MARDRSQRIIAILSGRAGWVYGKDLAARLGVSLRTIQTEIAAINADEQLPMIISNKRLGYRLEDRSHPHSFAGIFPGDHAATADDYLFEGQIIMTLLFEHDWMSAEAISRRLFVSRSTVVSHLSRVKRIVPRTKGARLSSSTGRGLRIEGSEGARRTMCMKNLDVVFDERLFLGVGDFRGLRRDADMLKRELAALLLARGRLLTDSSLSSLVNYIVISVMRSCFGFTWDSSAPDPDDAFVEDAASLVLSLFGYRMSGRERLGFLQLMSGLDDLSLPSDASSVPAPGPQSPVVERFSECVKRELGVDLDMDPALTYALATHALHLKRRMESGIVSKGRHTGALFRAHPLAVHILRTCFDLPTQTPIPDAELGYLVPYVSEAIEAKKSPVRVLLVSDESDGITFCMRRAIDRFAAESGALVDVLPRYAFTFLSREDAGAYDVLLTTDVSLSLAEGDAIFIGKDWSPRALEPVRAHIMCAREHVDERSLKVMLEDYPLVPFVARDQRTLTGLFASGDLVGLASFLGVGGEGTGCNVSVETIGESLLCVIAHGPARRSRISYGPCAVFSYQGKRIREMLVVRYALDVDAIAFFAYVRDLLCNRFEHDRMDACVTDSVKP